MFGLLVACFVIGFAKLGPFLRIVESPRRKDLIYYPRHVYLFYTNNARQRDHWPHKGKLSFALSFASVLRFHNNALQLFKNGKLLVCRINFGVALLFGMQKANML